MTKTEFEERIGKTVSESDYKAIETVYTFHPAIDNIRGKDQIATIYSTAGITVIYDMLERAEMARDLERQIGEARDALTILEAKYNELRFCK